MKRTIPSATPFSRSYMPSNFQISNLQITGFRGLERLDMAFSPGQPTYIIGPNNAGKSSVIAAIALVLRGGGFHKFVPGRHDFYHPPTGEAVSQFRATLGFEATDDAGLPAVQGAGDPQRVHGIQVRGDYKEESGSHTRYLIDRAGKAITYSTRTPLKGAKKDEFKGQGLGWTPRNARIDDIRDHIPEVWLLRPDNLKRSLYDWQTGPLQLLARLLTNRFFQSEWSFVYGGKSKPMPKSIELVHRFALDAVAAFPFWRDELKPRLDEALSAYLGKQSRVELRLSIQTVQEWLTQQLVAGFASDAGGAATPLETMGDGWQSLVRLAALDVLRAYPEVGKERVVLLFEEPETYLHPHLRRKLRKVLGDLAQAGWMVVATTHAPEFLSLNEPQSIYRLRREGGTVLMGAFQSGTTSDSVRLQAKLDERGTHELFFGNRVVLCEGKDDTFALKTYFEKTQTDLDGASVTILDVGGVGSMPDYASILRHLSIPWCALTDEDLQADGTPKPTTAAVRASLQAIQTTSDLCPIWPVSLENCLGVPAGHKAKPEWQARNVANRPLADLRTRIPAYTGTGDAISSWLQASHAPGRP